MVPGTVPPCSCRTAPRCTESCPPCRSLCTCRGDPADAGRTTPCPGLHPQGRLGVGQRPGPHALPWALLARPAPQEGHCPSLQREINFTVDTGRPFISVPAKGRQCWQCVWKGDMGVPTSPLTSCSPDACL